jgi:hypothetical protein
MKRATVTVEVCTDMELNATHEQLSIDLAKRERSGVNDDRLTGDPLARQIVEIERQMAEHVVLFTLRALPRKLWVGLKAAHPPREDDTVDEAYGVNVSTFVDAALIKSIESVTHKANGEVIEFNPATDWAGFADELTNGQWEAFANRLFALNNSNVAVPFNSAASKKTQTSGEN